MTLPEGGLIALGSLLVLALFALWRGRLSHRHSKAFRFGFTIWVERTNEGDDSSATNGHDPSP